MPLETSHEPHEHDLSLAASRPFDFHAWIAIFERECLFFRVDAEKRLSYVGGSVREILGYRPSDLIGENYQDFFELDHPIDACLDERSHLLLADSRPDFRICVARRRDGARAFLALRERTVYDVAGEPLGSEMMARDVTARVNAELSLSQSERKYRCLIEGIKGDYIIFSRDATGVFTYVSPSEETVLGYRPDEIIGQDARQLFYGMLDGCTLGQELPERGEIKPLENFLMEVRHADLRRIVLEIQERPIFALDGSLAGFEGIAKDVTEPMHVAREIRELKDDLERRVALRTDELLRTNEDLRASEARYRDVVDTQNEFIVRWIPDGTRTFVNEAFCRFRATSREDLVGQSFLPVIHPDDRRLFYEALGAITPADPAATCEVRNSRLDGSWAWVQWTHRAFFNSEAVPREYQSVGRDVTALRTASDMLRQKEAHLAHMSRLSTMGEMVAGIVHEVAQPLHAAKTFAEAARRHLQSGRPDKVDSAIGCMTEISDAVVRTSQIVRRLRDFTKGRPFRLELISLNSIVREAVELLAYETRRVGAALHLELDEALPAIRGDHVQLEQLCVNLLKNACEAMEHWPEPVLVVRTLRTAGHACLDIQDSGCGIDPADAHRVYDAFYSTKEHGMGMGLNLCKSIADAHGIAMSFDANANGRGVTFHLAIPVVEEPPP